MKTILVDTREQKAGHVEKWFEQNGVRFVRTKLLVGDYQELEQPMVVVDRKASMGELYGNLCHDHKRFRAECERAQELGIRLVVLIENGRIGTLEGVRAWKNPRLKHTPYAWDGDRMCKVMQTMQEKYGVAFLFCDKRRTARRIIEILEAGAREG